MPIASFEEEQKLAQETVVPQQNLLHGMSGWLVRKGLAANQTSADLTLLVLVGAIIVFSIFVYSVGSNSGTGVPDTEKVTEALTLPADVGRSTGSSGSSAF